MTHVMARMMAAAHLGIGVQRILLHRGNGGRLGHGGLGGLRGGRGNRRRSEDGNGKQRGGNGLQHGQLLSKGTAEGAGRMTGLFDRWYDLTSGPLNPS